MTEFSAYFLFLYTQKKKDFSTEFLALIKINATKSK